MELLVKSSSEELATLIRRLNSMSADLRSDAVETEYILSQFKNSISGGETMVDDAMNNVQYCTQLSDSLNRLADCLKRVYSAQSNADESIASKLLYGL